MQERHQRWQVPMGGDEFFAYVTWMRRRVAQPPQIRQRRQLPQQAAQAPVAAIRRLTVPRVDVLAQERDLARSLPDQPTRLGDDRRSRSTGFRAARVRHDAETAE